MNVTLVKYLIFYTSFEAQLPTLPPWGYETLCCSSLVLLYSLATRRMFPFSSYNFQYGTIARMFWGHFQRGFVPKFYNSWYRIAYLWIRMILKFSIFIFNAASKMFFLLARHLPQGQIHQHLLKPRPFNSFNFNPIFWGWQVTNCKSILSWKWVQGFRCFLIQLFQVYSRLKIFTLSSLTSFSISFWLSSGSDSS